MALQARTTTHSFDNQPFVELVADHSIHLYIDAIAAQIAAAAPAKAVIPRDV